MEDALRSARKTGCVHGEGGGTSYLALHPIYSTSPRLHRCMGLCQMAITLLNLLGFVCALLGHLLPYCQTRYGMEQWYVWARVWSNGQLLPFIDWRRDLGAVQMAAVMAAVSGLVSFVVTAFLPSAWSRVETARMREDEENKQLREVCARRAALLNSTSGPPLSHTRGFTESLCPPLLRVPVMNHGQARRVRLEERELRRRGAAGRLAMAALGCMICSTLSSVATVVALRIELWEVRSHQEEQARWALGFICFLVASASGMTSIALFVVQQEWTRVRPCRPCAAVPCCLLVPKPKEVVIAK